MRQVYTSGKWREGLPTEQSQQFRYMTPSGWVYGFYELPAVDDTGVKITKRAFYDRLRKEEEIAIDLAGYEATPEAAEIRRFMRRVDSSPFVDLEFHQTIEGVHAMEQFGLIAEGRAAEILSPPVNEDEKWRG